MLSPLPALLLLACSEQGISTEDPANGGEPAVRVDPMQLDLGVIEGGQQAEARLSVDSVGEVGLTVFELGLVDATPGLELLAPDLPTVLPPGASLSAMVRFEAHTTEAGGLVQILTDDPSQPRVDVPVHATADLTWVELQPDPLDFGTVTPGTVVQDLVDLVNPGNIDLVVDTIVLLADDIVLVDPPALPLTIPPGDAYALPLKFAPVQRSEEQAQLWVGSNSWLGDTMGSVHGRGGWQGISGRICDPSGTDWVIDARVFASIDYDGDGRQDWETETRTDSGGRYTLEDVPPGTWTIQVEKGSFSASFEVEVPESGGVYELSEDTCLDPDSVSLAVISGEYDHVESIVASLGLDFELYGDTGGLRSLLQDPDLLASYDVLFLNCSDYRSLEKDLETDSRVLAQFVEAGGSVYASDWASLVVEATWPELVDLYGNDEVFENTAVGASARIEAQVVDTIMAYAVGSTTAEIVFDLDAWVVPLAAGAGVDVLVQGTVPTFTSTEPDVPLAVRAEPGGRLIFTTFHNEQQLTEDMEAALKEIILSL